MSDARYYSITLQIAMGEPGTYELSFSTMPGMSASITDLRMGDLDALAGILSDRNDPDFGGVIATPRRPHSWEPCAHCSGVGSGCHCDVEYA